jgi:glutamate/aspartate transport system permease protein
VNYTWDWGILLRAPYTGWLLVGVGWTLALTVVSWSIGLVVGTMVGTARSLPSGPLRMAATAYVELFRNVPPLVQLFLWFFVFPEVVPDTFGLWIKRDLPQPEFTTAALAIGLFAGARVAEQMRAGIATARGRLLQAALATGLRPAQAYRLVLLPIALRLILVPLTSEFLTTFKMSAIALTVGVLELTAQSQRIENETFHGFEVFTAATAIYLVIGLGITGAMRLLAGRLRVTGVKHGA